MFQTLFFHHQGVNWSMLQLLTNNHQGWKIRFSNPGTDKGFVSSTNRKDRLEGGGGSGPSNILVNGYLQIKRPERENDHLSTSVSPYMLSWWGQEKLYLVQYLLGGPNFNAIQFPNLSRDILNSFSCRGDSSCSVKTSTCCRTRIAYISFFVCH